MDLRKCSNCYCEKPVTEFYTKKYKTNSGQIYLGFQNRCKPCNSEISTAYAREKRWKESRSERSE